MDNQIMQGDCAHILADLPTESVDMVYLDPPFFTQREWTGTSGASFSDKWRSMEDYLGFIEVRVRDCRRVLKRSGSIFLHCDDTASHYIKVMLDDVFGMDNYLNEIIWKRVPYRHSTSKFGRIHDTILFYSKDRPKTYWSGYQTKPRPGYIQEFFTQDAEDGRGPYRRIPITTSFERGTTGKPWRGISPPKGAKWTFNRSFPGGENLPKDTFEALEALDKMGRIHWPKKGGKPLQKSYLSELSGTNLQDVITDISNLNAFGGNAGEDVGYPTQKPVALLDRLIRATTDLNDVVLDPFCGSGTTLVAAAKAGRRYIGIDRSPDAIETARNRIRNETRQGSLTI